MVAALKSQSGPWGLSGLQEGKEEKAKFRKHRRLDAISFG